MTTGLSCVFINASEAMTVARKELLCVKEQLQEEREMRLETSMLASDFASKLDKQEDEREVVKTIEDTPQVHPLIEE